MNDQSGTAVDRGELESLEFSLQSEISRVIKPLAKRAQRKGLELILHVTADVPRQVKGDPVGLGQIVENLVSNAIQFTDSGEIAIEISKTEALVGAELSLRLCVMDTGRGIPIEQQQRLLRPAAQQNGSVSTTSGKTGLGLVITQHLLSAMGGGLSLASAPGKGSTFCATMCFGVAENQPANGLHPALSGRAVLVVAGNAVLRSHLIVLLHDGGVRTAEAATVIAAGRQLEQALEHGEPFDVVLVDSGLLDDSGWSVVELVYNHPDYAEAVVMMLTQDEAQQLAHADDKGRRNRVTCLDKPFFPAQLTNALSEALGLPQQAPSGKEKGIRRHGRRLELLVAEDNQLNQKLAQRLLEKMGHHVVLADTGKEALELWQAHPFDAILMDVDMPVMNGYEATAGIRARERGSGRHIPIIAMTAHVMSGAHQDCLAAGMDGFLSKPISVAALWESLHGIVQSGSRSDYVDMEKNPALYAEIVRIFLNDFPEYLSAMRSALSGGDQGELRRSAHALKGMCMVLSAQAASDAAWQVELAAGTPECGDAVVELEHKLALLKAELEAKLGVLEK